VEACCAKPCGIPAVIPNSTTATARKRPPPRLWLFAPALPAASIQVFDCWVFICSLFSCANPKLRYVTPSLFQNQRLFPDLCPFRTDPAAIEHGIGASDNWAGSPQSAQSKIHLQTCFPASEGIRLKRGIRSRKYGPASDADRKRLPGPTPFAGTSRRSGTVFWVTPID
jgi:hypothetical protein